MKVRFALGSFLLLSFAGGIHAQIPDPGFLPNVEAIEQGKDKDKKQPDKDKKQPEEKKTPPVDIFSNLVVPRAETTTGYTPSMLGDFPVVFARRSVPVPSTQTTVTTPNAAPTPPTTTTTSTSQNRNLLVSSPIRGDLKVAENMSPRPADRVFFMYNYYSGLRGPNPADREPINQSQTTNQPGPPSATVTQQTFIPGAPLAYLSREILGFEKTFLDGRASIEVRIPFLQQTASLDGFSSSNVGDMRIVGKYALLLDQTTGDVLSGGLAVTVPTGPAIDTTEGTIRSTLLQPWFGYIRNWDRVFVQGFHSIVVPTDPRDVTILFNDISLNFWLVRRDSSDWLRFVVSVAEIHVTTPLNHRGFDNPIVVPDLVTFTTGVHFGIARNSVLSFGLATPLNGPRIYDYEAFAQINWYR